MGKSLVQEKTGFESLAHDYLVWPKHVARCHIALACRMRTVMATIIEPSSPFEDACIALL